MLRLLLHQRLLLLLLRITPQRLPLLLPMQQLRPRLTRLLLLPRRLMPPHLRPPQPMPRLLLLMRPFRQQQLRPQKKKPTRTVLALCGPTVTSLHVAC